RRDAIGWFRRRDRGTVFGRAPLSRGFRGGGHEGEASPTPPPGPRVPERAKGGAPGDGPEAPARGGGPAAAPAATPAAARVFRGGAGPWPRRRGGGDGGGAAVAAGRRWRRWQRRHR